MDAQDAQDYCHRPPCPRSGHRFYVFLLTWMYRMHRIIVIDRLPQKRTSSVSYRASPVQQRPVLVILFILLIHVFMFFINMDVQDEQDYCHRLPCPRFRASSVSYRASELPVQQRPVLVILFILLIHVFMFFINMDAQDAQDYCHRPPCPRSGHRACRIARVSFPCSNVPSWLSCSSC